MAKRKRSFHKATVAEMEKRGWVWQKVEHQLGHVKKDLWCGDYIALDGEPGSHLIQVTSSNNHAARRKKIYACDEAVLWVEWSNRFTIWSFRDDMSMREEEITIA